MGKRVTGVPQLSYLVLRGGALRHRTSLCCASWLSFLQLSHSCELLPSLRSCLFRNPLVILDRPTIPFDQVVRLGIRRRNCVFKNHVGFAAIFVPTRSCLLKGLLVLRLAHRVTCLTNSQARSCLLKGLLVLQPSATHRVTCLANSRPGLACSRSYWSCSLLTGLPILQTHRPGLACSRNYWSCSPQPLTELPVLQTHDLVLLLKELLVLQLQLAHRITYLADSRLDSLVGPTARSAETCSRQRNFAIRLKYR